MNKLVGLVVALAVCGSAMAENYTCVQHAYNYGLASNAKENCGFREMNDAVIEYFQDCHAMAESQGQTSLLVNAVASGIKDFNRQFVQTKNKKAICQAFQQEFSDFVR